MYALFKENSILRFAINCSCLVAILPSMCFVKSYKGNTHRTQTEYDWSVLVGVLFDTYISLILKIQSDICLEIVM